MEWYIGYNDDYDWTLPEIQVNPQYCLCKRYFPTHPNDRRWFGEYIKEVISVDHLLFPQNEQTILNEDQAESISVEEGSQVLRVFCMLDENGDLDDPHIAEKCPAGFEFCGFDMADFGGISAILNCGSFTDGDYFSEAFDYRELNDHGLISDYASAVEIRRKLREECDDSHADCIMFAIWRRIK